MAIMVWLVIFAFALLSSRMSTLSIMNASNYFKSRDFYGDTFTVASWEICSKALCNLNGRRAANVLSGFQSKHSCTCQCSQSFKTFRDDTKECVSEIEGCVHAKFVRDGSSENIPFVFLPPAGQILHPSYQINIPGKGLTGQLSCKVIRTSYLKPQGWKNFKHDKNENLVQLKVDGDRMHLQWNGNKSQEEILSSHIVKIILHCTKKLKNNVEENVRPCVVFRVAGTSPMYITKIKHEQNDSSDGKPNKYIIIGLSIVLLGVMYVIAVFIFITVRKKRIQNRKMVALEAKMKSLESSANSVCDDSDHQYDSLDDIVTFESESAYKSAVNDHYKKKGQNNSVISTDITNNNFQESAPEENVHIEETDAQLRSFQHKRDVAQPVIPIPQRPKCKRIYFNPSFFERDMLLNPPPAAEEFSRKIHDMINIAKLRIRNKRYLPKLNVVPEDDYFYQDLSEPIKDYGNLIECDDKNYSHFDKDAVCKTIAVESEAPVLEKVKNTETKNELDEIIIQKDEYVVDKKTKPIKNIRKLSAPPPPPPRPSTTSLSKHKSFPKEQKKLSPFDLFRQDLEMKIKNMNLNRLSNDSNSKLKSNQEKTEGTSGKTNPVATDDDSQKTSTKSNKNYSFEKKLSKPNVCRSKAFKFSRNNIVNKPKDSIKLISPKNTDDVPSRIECQVINMNNEDSNVIKLHSSYHDRTEPSLNELQYTKHGTQPELAKNRANGGNYSTKISIVNPTVIQIHAHQLSTKETTPNLVKIQKNNSSVVMIVNSTANINNIAPIENIYSSKNSIKLESEELSKSNDICCSENAEENNFSSDSAIDDTSIPSSPIDSNSEKSVLINHPNLEHNINQKILQVAKSTPSESGSLNRWLKNSQNSGYVMNTVEEWLTHTGENKFSNILPEVPKIERLNDPESLSSDISSESISGFDTKSTGKQFIRSNFKKSPVKPPRKSQCAESTLELKLPETPTNEPSNKIGCGSSTNNKEVTITVHDWLAGTDEGDDGEEEIIPNVDVESSQFLPPTNIYNAKRVQPQYCYEPDQPSFNLIDSSKLIDIDGKKSSRHKDIRRRPGQFKQRAQKASNNHFVEDDPASSIPEKSSEKVQEKLAVAQETLLEHIAQTFTKTEPIVDSLEESSDVCSKVSTCALPVEGRRFDKLKLKALLSGHIQSNETIL